MTIIHTTSRTTIIISNNNKRQSPSTSPPPSPPSPTKKPQQHHYYNIKSRKNATTIRLLLLLLLFLFHYLLILQHPPQPQSPQGIRNIRSMFSSWIYVSFADAFLVVTATSRQFSKRRYHHDLHYYYYYHDPSSSSSSKQRLLLVLRPPQRWSSSLSSSSSSSWNSVLVPTKKRRRRNWMTSSSSLSTSNHVDVHDINDHETTITVPSTFVESTKAIEELVQTWRDHPNINPKIHFPTWICYSGQYIQSILQSPIIQPYLATQFDLIQHLHVRFRVIRKYDEIMIASDPITTSSLSNHTNIKQAKFIVLHPNTPRISHLPLEVQTQLHQAGCFDTMNPHDDNDDGNDMDDHQQQDTPHYVVQFQYHQFTASYVMNQLLPMSVHPVPAAFETVGHVAHLNLKQHHIPYRTMIGEILYETVPNIETVIQKVGDVTGPYRTFQYEVLAGKTNHTFVQLIESGASLHFDLQHVYWCSRLSKERQRLLQHEIFHTPSPPPPPPPPRTKTNMTLLNTTTTATTFNRTIVIADVFCGVGAFCIQAAMAHPNIEIWANDWNPHAIVALRNNAIRNSVSHQLTRLTCIDAYNFIMELGMMTSSSPTLTSLESVTTNHSQTGLTEDGPETFEAPTSPKVHQRRRYHRKKDNRNKGRNGHDTPARSMDQGGGVIRLPDHVVMNFPLEAPKFLGALRWWSASACGDGKDEPLAPQTDNPNNDRPITPRIHVYTFARNSANNSNDNKNDDDDDDDNDDDDRSQGNDVGIDDRSVEDIAVDLVADNLLPTLSPNNSERYAITKDASQQGSRRQELNDLYNCNVRTHIVRDVAPGKRVVCVSFSVTSKLLRHMRGDFL